MCPQLSAIRRDTGLAGQISYTVDVTYPDEGARTVQFVGSTYGGPVVMLTEDGLQTFVEDPQRFGDFGPEWVRRFFEKP